jgi:N,N'-diacetyllegionaminate synthase
VARKSLVAGRDLPAGTVLRREDLVILRPGTGLPPSALPRVVGRRTARAVAADSPLTEDMLAPQSASEKGAS